MILSVLRRAWAKKITNDHSGLSMNFIKNVTLNIAETPTFICNMSLSNGYSPQRMIIAKVVPIHKS